MNEHAGQNIAMRAHNALNSARRGRQPTTGSMRSGAQITPFGVTPGGHIGDQVADHIGGSVRVLPDPPILLSVTTG
jgi:hypothetical protein